METHGTLERLARALTGESRQPLRELTPEERRALADMTERLREQRVAASRADLSLRGQASSRLLRASA